MTGVLTVVGIGFVAAVLWHALRCRHPEMIRKRDGGVLYLVCSACHYRERAITRTPEDFRRMKRLQKQITPKATKAPARVLPMRRDA